MNFRKADFEDIPTLAAIRKRQLIDEGSEPNVDIDSELTAFFEDGMRDGSLVEWVLEDEGEIVATGAIIFYRFPPSFTNPSGWRGYVANMYTRNDFRKWGIATQLLEKLVDEARSRGVRKLWLGASRMGRPVYQKFGFRETDEWMVLDV